jgi:hypothetical protein
MGSPRCAGSRNCLRVIEVRLELAVDPRPSHLLGPPNEIPSPPPPLPRRPRGPDRRPPEPAPAWGAEGQDRIEDGDGAFAVLAAMALACARAAAPIVDAVATIPMVMQFAAGDLGAPSGFTAAPDRADRGRQALRQALRNGAAILAAMSCATSSSLCRYARSGFPRESQRSPRTL